MNTMRRKKFCRLPHDTHQRALIDQRKCASRALRRCPAPLPEGEGGMLKCRRNVPGLPVIRQDRDMEQCQNFTVTHDSRGVATVSFDMPGRRYNVLTEQAFLELEQIANHLADSPAVRCVVFSSGKDSGFVAGADLKELSALPNAECAAQLVSLGQRVFDRIEALAIPTVAVIHGPCLGGGLEFALACKYRAACDEPSNSAGNAGSEAGPYSGLGRHSAAARTHRARSCLAIALARPCGVGPASVGNGLG